MAGLALAQSPALRLAVEQNYVCRPAGFPHAPCTYKAICGNYAEACLWKKTGSSAQRRNFQAACFGCATWMIGDHAQQCSLMTADQMRCWIGTPEAFGWTISDHPNDAFQVVADFEAYKRTKPHTAAQAQLPAPPLGPLGESITVNDNFLNFSNESLVESPYQG